MTNVEGATELALLPHTPSVESRQLKQMLRATQTIHLFYRSANAFTLRA
ncbi:hypothetical protein [Coleofasciculus sp. F4-SAH-05]